MPAAIYFFNVLNDAAALMLVRADFLSVFEKPQRLAMLFLNLHGQGFVAGEIFDGLWLFPLAVLACRSRFLPPSIVGGWLGSVTGV